MKDKDPKQVILRVMCIHCGCKHTWFLNLHTNTYRCIACNGAGYAGLEVIKALKQVRNIPNQ